jgi:hypothetical protein
MAILIGVACLTSLVIVGVAVGVSAKNTSIAEVKPTIAPTVAPTDAPTEPPEDCPWCELRIPKDVYLPKKYDLTLEPDLEPKEGNTFKGKVVATVDVLQPTSVFMIHIKYLNVTSTKLSGNHEVDETFHYEENQFWVVKTKAKVPVG